MLLSHSLSPGRLLSQCSAIIITATKLETKTVPGTKCWQIIMYMLAEYNEYAGSELADLECAGSFGTGVLAAAVTEWHLGDLMEQISFCAQKEAGFDPFTWN